MATFGRGRFQEVMDQHFGKFEGGSEFGIGAKTYEL